LNRPLAFRGCDRPAESAMLRAVTNWHFLHPPRPLGEGLGEGIKSAVCGRARHKGPTAGGEKTTTFSFRIPWPKEPQMLPVCLPSRGMGFSVGLGQLQSELPHDAALDIGGARGDGEARGHAVAKPHSLEDLGPLLLLEHGIDL